MLSCTLGSSRIKLMGSELPRKEGMAVIFSVFTVPLIPCWFISMGRFSCSVMVERRRVSGCCAFAVAKGNSKANRVTYEIRLICTA